MNIKNVHSSLNLSYKPHSLFIFLLALSCSHFSNAALVAINEIHYDNAGSDVGEAVELVGISGTDLSDWSLVLYNGGDNLDYRTIDLTGAAASNESGFSFWHIPISSFQNGPNDGIALVNQANSVIEFLSYEGVVNAAGGVANGLTSIDIGVAESSATLAGTSLQRIGEISILNGQISFLNDSWESNSESWATANINQQFAQTVPIPSSIGLLLSAIGILFSFKTQSRKANQKRSYLQRSL